MKTLLSGLNFKNSNNREIETNGGINISDTKSQNNDKTKKKTPLSATSLY